MQVNVEVWEDADDTVVTIKCKKRDAFVERLIAACQMVNRRIMVTCGGAVKAVELADILYIESVDRKCFVYTKKEVYESQCRLYELEQQLAQYQFVRINKSGIVNLNNIESIKTYINRRLLLTLSNGEQLIASRQYASEIKELLGVK